MSSESLQQFTEMFGGALPAEYLKLLDNYPDVLRQAMRALDESDAEGSVAQVELFENTDCVLELNLEARQDSVTEPEGLEFFWPEQLLIIGETGSGDYYCIDVDGEEEGVIQFDHQSVSFEIVADSLDDFVELLVETFSGQHSDVDFE